MNLAACLLVATAALSLAACSSSSEGGNTGGGSAGGGDQGGSSPGGGDPGTGGEGGGCVGDDCGCADVPLDCIGGDYVTDADGCTVCDYWECGTVCPEGSPTSECVADDVMICDRGENDCGAIDLEVDPTCAGGFTCAAGAWTCTCPSSLPAEGAPCGDLEQTCEVPSDLNCGPATVTITCTSNGWTQHLLGGEGGGGAGGGGVGGGADCG